MHRALLQRALALFLVPCRLYAVLQSHSLSRLSRQYLCRRSAPSSLRRVGTGRRWSRTTRSHAHAGTVGGRALIPDRRAFCGEECAENYRQAMGKRRPVVEPVARASRKQHREATLAGRREAETLPASDGDALRRWYMEELQPRLSRMHPTEIALGAAMGRSYAYYIVAGTRIPHPRHYPSLAALVGVELPREFAAALSRPGGP